MIGRTRGDVNVGFAMSDGGSALSAKSCGSRGAGLVLFSTEKRPELGKRFGLFGALFRLGRDVEQIALTSERKNCCWDGAGVWVIV